MISTPFDPTPDEPDHKAPVRRLIESLDDLAAVPLQFPKTKWMRWSKKRSTSSATNTR